MEKKEPNDGGNKKNIVDKKKIMETAFSVLKQQGKNTSEGVFMFLKEKKILDPPTEKIARELLAGVSNPKDIDYTKFAEVCQTVAKEKGIDLGNISNKALDAFFTKLGGSTGTSTAATSMSDPAVAGGSNVNDNINELLDDHPEENDFHVSEEDSDSKSDDYHEPFDEQDISEEQEQ